LWWKGIVYLEELSVEGSGHDHDVELFALGLALLHQLLQHAKQNIRLQNQYKMSE